MQTFQIYAKVRALNKTQWRKYIENSHDDVLMVNLTQSRILWGRHFNEDFSTSVASDHAYEKRSSLNVERPSPQWRALVLRQVILDCVHVERTEHKQACLLCYLPALYCECQLAVLSSCSDFPAVVPGNVHEPQKTTKELIQMHSH